MNTLEKNIVLRSFCNQRIFAPDAFFIFQQNALKERKKFNQKMSNLLDEELAEIKEKANQDFSDEDSLLDEEETNRWNRQSFIESQIIFYASRNETLFKKLCHYIRALQSPELKEAKCSGKNGKKYHQYIEHINKQIEIILDTDGKVSNLKLEEKPCIDEFQDLANALKHDGYELNIKEESQQSLLHKNIICKEGNCITFNRENEISILDYIVDQYIAYYKSLEDIYEELSKLEKQIVEQAKKKLPKNFDVVEYAFSGK